jgi:type 2 lantibiotic biosynthesis protein LanM
MDELLRAIAAKASSIEERLTSPDLVPIDDPSQDDLIATRMRMWRQAAANDDVSAFRRRLAWDGLDEDLAIRGVRPVRLRAGAALPGWAATLGGILQLARSSTPQERCIDERAPVAFQEVLAPFVGWARTTCERQAGTAYARFADGAHASLERQLLESLSAHAAASLSLELTVESAVVGSPLDQVLESEPSREVYGALVRRMLAGGLGAFFAEYSVLARVLTSTTELWEETTVEMLQRFERDQDVLGEMLGIRGEIKTANIASRLSDPHNGLRSVAVLTLESGARVVYKPRTMAMESGWNALLESLGGIGAPVSFRTFRVVDRGDYGWAEHVQYAPCKDSSDAREYFRRAGALLCIVHLLHGTDCHGDNIIAVGADPVLVDVETMLSPQLPDSPVGAEAPRIARHRLSHSVLNTYLLPFWARSLQDGAVFDGSGFGADPEQDRASTSMGWVFVNTDRMKLAPLPNESKPAPRAAMANGEPLRVYEYEEELVSGFEAMYRFLRTKRQFLAGPDGPLQRLRGVQVRFVHRNTSLYSLVLSLLRKDHFCRDGVDRSLQIEQLALACLTGEAADGRPGWPDVFRGERKAIDRGDVPQFNASAGDTGLTMGHDVSVSGWFAQSGFDAAMERLGFLDETDLAFQVDLIRSSLRARVLRDDDGISASGAESPARPLPDNGEALLAEAIAIAHSLAEDAIVGSDGSASWLQPVWSREAMIGSPRRELDVVGNDLYEGGVGIGLFLAAVEGVTGGSGFRPIAMGAVRPLLIDLEERGEATADRMGIGGLAGMGSVVYGLVQMNRLLNEPELLRGAQRAAERITGARIDADVALDVSLGSAGALLGLLSLYEAIRSDAVLAAAKRCGDRLLSRFEPVEPGIRSVRTIQGRFLNGFSHGAAGMAYALCRLHAMTGDSRLLQGAHELVGFERRSFSVEYGNWPDLRYPGAPRFMLGWCHGAPGIALGRIASLGSIDDQETRQEIDLALGITERQGQRSADFLCCGTFGAAEALSTAGRLLGRPELSERARLLAWQIVSRSNDGEEYVLGVPSAGRLRCRGLFQGLPGIGYTLLRLLRPDILPEILLLR